MQKAPLLGACLALPLAIAGLALAADTGCWTQAVASPAPLSTTEMAVQQLAEADALFQRIATEMNAMEAQMDALAALPFTLPTYGESFPPGLAGAPWTGNVPATES